MQFDYFYGNETPQFTFTHTKGVCIIISIQQGVVQ